MSFLLLLFANPLAYVDILSSPHPDIPKSETSPAMDVRKLAKASELSSQPLIQYAYNPLPALPRHTQQFRFQAKGRITMSPLLSGNAVHIDPFSAGLPYRSSLAHIYASKYRGSNLTEAINLLTLLASDESVSDIEVGNGIIMARLARKALEPGRPDRMTLATHYMFPCADQERIRLISALILIYFNFDGMSFSQDDDNRSLRRGGRAIQYS